MSEKTKDITNNVSFDTLYTVGVWRLKLKYSDEQIQNIVNLVYKMEKEKYTSGSRTFKHQNGFHTDNLTVKKEFHPFINDVLKLVNNELSLDLKTNDKYGNYSKNPHVYFTTNDVWAIIWRKGDFNAPHFHQDYHLAGAFYFKVPDVSNSGGGLAFANPNKSSLPIYDNSNENGLSHKILKPSVGEGILFRADRIHYVLPSYTNEDRISIAFNFKLENINFSDIVPTPNWLPLSIYYKFPENDTEINEIIKTGKCKYKLSDNSYLYFNNPYKGNLIDVKGKQFDIFF